MGFFGLMNGKCYCAPYYKAEAGDSSQCDSACPGDNTLMCGGASKSNVFAMHNCDSTQADLTAAETKATTLAGDMKSQAKTASDLSKDMQKAGASLQKSFGNVGDTAASGLMQKAKEFAGKIEAQVDKVQGLESELKELSKQAKAIKDFKDPAEVTEAESIMSNIDKTTAEGTLELSTLEEMIELASPKDDTEKAAEEYFPVMYFVDKKYEEVPTTCGGDLVNDPIINESPDGCASSCNANFQSCVGFSYFGPEKLCFLFSELDTAFYYTGCKGSFLQQSHRNKATAIPPVTCYAKVSKFEGTTLKPDPSGKCKQCLRKATKADRCYK
jgi:hypothetical protein